MDALKILAGVAMFVAAVCLDADAVERFLTDALKET